jgi:hypothetical protein
MRLSLLILCLVIGLGATSCSTYVVAKTPQTTVIRTAPKHHKIVVLKGKRYYFWNGKHYKKTRRGFVVVRV